MIDIETALQMLLDRNKPAPKPAPLPSLSEIEAAEAKSGHAFPADFRRYLLEASNVSYGAIEPVTITTPQSHTNFLSVLDDARTYGVPDDLLPICEDNADFYCLNNRGEVVYWSHNGSTSEKWPSLADWIVKVWIEGG